MPAVTFQGYAGAKVELRYSSAADPVLMRQVGSEMSPQFKRICWCASITDHAAGKAIAA
jgi:hypothetical protein